MPPGVVQNKQLKLNAGKNDKQDRDTQQHPAQGDEVFLLRKGSDDVVAVDDTDAGMEERNAKKNILDTEKDDHTSVLSSYFHPGLVMAVLICQTVSCISIFPDSWRQKATKSMNDSKVYHPQEVSLSLAIW